MGQFEYSYHWFCANVGKADRFAFGRSQPELQFLVQISAAQGFRTGDVILDVAGKQVASPDDVRKAISDARTGGKRTVLLRVKSGEGTRFLAVPLGRG